MILLINPPAPTVPTDTYDVPLGLSYIGGILKEKGIDVYGLDLGRNLNTDVITELKAKLLEINPKIVGITSVSATYESARDIISFIKNSDSTILTIHGGVHVTLALDKVIIDPLNTADILVIGEGEESICEILDSYSTNKQYTSIKGIAIRSDSNYIITPKRKRIDKLDNIPIPAREIFDVSNIPVMRILTSRGCPFDCTFCASSVIWDHSIRFHSSKRVFEEIELLIRNFNISKILIVDDTFAINKDRAINILNGLSKYSLEFSCLTRVDLINDDLLDNMKRANISMLSFGCESGNQFILDSLRKKISVNQIIEAIRLCKKYNIKTRTSWVWGLPFDTIDTLRDTIAIISSELPDDVIIYRFVPYPGTEYYKYYPELENLKPALFHSGIENFLVPTKSMSIKEMEEIFANAFLELYKIGYKAPEQALINDKTVSSGFTKFNSFWPKTIS